MNLLYFTLIFSLLYSLIEIEIEGKYGWMEKAYSVGVLEAGGKNFTLYHIYMILVLILIYAYVTDLKMNSKSIGVFIFHITLFLLLEDFLWFVFNPYYTIKKYNKNINWHSNQKWLFGMPLHNYIGIMILLLMTYLTNEITLLKNLGILLPITIIIIYLAPIYHKFYTNCH